jgi:hypothetical protein
MSGVFTCCVGWCSTQKEKIDLIILGKQSIDSDNGQTGQVILSNLSHAMRCDDSMTTVYYVDASRLAELVAVHVFLQLDLFRR